MRVATRISLVHEGFLEHYWYRDGKIHRDDGPAITREGGVEWYSKGLRHRLDGPAWIMTDRESGTGIAHHVEGLWCSREQHGLLVRYFEERPDVDPDTEEAIAARYEFYRSLGLW